MVHLCKAQCSEVDHLAHVWKLCMSAGSRGGYRVRVGLRGAKKLPPFLPATMAGQTDSFQPATQQGDKTFIIMCRKNWN